MLQCELERPGINQLVRDSLTDDTVDILKRAAFHQHPSNEQSFDIRVLTKDGGTEILVFLGEFHAQDESGKEISNEVLGNFPRKAVEGWDTSRLFMGEEYGALIRAWREQYREKYQCPEPGAITLANEDYNNRSDRFCVMLQELNDELGSIIAEIEAGRRDRTEPVIIRFDLKKHQLDQSDVIGLVRALASRLGDIGEPREDIPERKNFKLEENHEPSIYEHLESANICIGERARQFILHEKTIAAVGLSLCAAPISGLLNWLVPNPVLATIALASSAVVCGYLAIIYGRVALHRTHLNEITSTPLNDMIASRAQEARDATMVGNIINLESLGELNFPLLIQTGQAHVSPIATQLVQKHGWREIPLKDL